MTLADEIQNGLDEETLTDIINKNLLSEDHKELLEDKGLSLGDVLNGRGVDEETYALLFSDWNAKLGRVVFGIRQDQSKYKETITLAFESAQEKVIFEEYLEGYTEWRLQYNKLV